MDDSVQVDSAIDVTPITFKSRKTINGLSVSNVSYGSEDDADESDVEAEEVSTVSGGSGVARLENGRDEEEGEEEDEDVNVNNGL